MINIFFDYEFSKLQLPLDPEPNQLISIGCISEEGKRFYAENSTTLARPEIFSEFVIETVVPLLEGGKYLMPYADIAQSLKDWLESFNEDVKMWSDAPYFSLASCRTPVRYLWLAKKFSTETDPPYFCYLNSNNALSSIC